MNISNFRLMLISAIHLGVGASIVVLSSFLNAELRLNDWPTSTISFFLGLPVLFELVRLPFAHLYDAKGILKRSLGLGLLFSFVGLLTIPYLITPISNFALLAAVSAFYFGSSILTTLVDANATILTSDGERSRVAGIIQFFRLLGFALGGVLGSVLYRTLLFTEFLSILAVFYLGTGVVSMLFTISTNNTTLKSSSLIRDLRKLPSLVLTGMPLLMTLFLIFYPIGLFMQDLILEPFAIDRLGFQRDSVGRLVAIWTTLTLVFVPVGVVLARRFSRLGIIIVGEVLSFVGVLLFALTTSSGSLTIFYTGLVMFGIGNGIASAPAIGMMLDVCAIYPGQVALLLGFFGIMNTLGRTLAATSAGLILVISSNNYQVLFLVEAVIVAIGLIPLILLDPQLRKHALNTDVINPIDALSVDLT